MTSSKPKLLDLFCKAGGAAMGYHRAGFDVVGVDIEPQPRYPFRFVQADALEFLRERGHEFHAVHASPPCQGYSGMSNCRPGLADKYPLLIDDVRRVLASGKAPWVIENVDGAPLARASNLFGDHGVMLCGQMFYLQLYRHRIFETSFPIAQPRHPKHIIPASKAGHWKPGTIISVSGNCAPVAVSRQAMGIDWMTRDQLAEAIPPAYTQFIGERLIRAIE